MQRFVEFERSSTVVRLVYGSQGSAVLLFRRLDGSSRPLYFLLDNGAEYLGCSATTAGGRLRGVEVDLESVGVVSEGRVYSFRYYARSRGLPESSVAVICELSFDGNYPNAVITLDLANPPPSLIRVTLLALYSGRFYLVSVYEYVLQSAD